MYGFTLRKAGSSALCSMNVSEKEKKSGVRPCSADSIQRLYLVGEGRGMGAVRIRNVRAPYRECSTPKWLTEVNGKMVKCVSEVGLGNYMVDDYGERANDGSGNMPVGTDLAVFQGTSDGGQRCANLRP